MQKHPKIIFVHLFNDRSGSPKVLAQVVTALHNAGLKGELLTSNHEDGFLTDVPIVRRTLFYRRSSNKLLTLFWYALGQLLLFGQCLRYWRQDVEFYINTMMPAGAALAAWLMGKRVIYHVHETSIKPDIFKKCLRAVIQLTASKVVFVSGFLRDSEAFINKPQALLYNSIELPELPVVHKNNFNVLMVCSLKAYKGVQEFVQLATRLADQPDMNFTLVLNADQQEINAYFATSLPLNLQIVPRQQSLTSFYQAASVLLNLSRPHECIETFGLTILEAMSYGVPVIVPPVGGPAEVVRDGREGFLRPCTELASIADILVRWRDQPEYYAGFCQHARQRAADFELSVFEQKVREIVY